MGLQVCLQIAKFIAKHTNSKTVVNPFCGEGGFLAAANAFDLEVIGIERSPKRAAKARLQQITEDRRNWELRPD